MKLFLDANILVSVLNKEYPLFPFTSRILSLSGRFQFFTSPVCLAIAFYFAEKKTNAAVAKQKIDLLCRYVTVAGNSGDAVQKTLNNPRINDFEDGLEYYAALESGCICILSEDTGDFHFSDLEVINSVDFCRKYMANDSKSYQQ